MKLSKLYSNRSDLFQPILFNPGLNVILAEIRLPENRDKDTHNLGKSTLGRLLDFCFLSSKNKNFFLFKHFEKFKNFTFFLELKLLNDSYVTIRRSVNESSKISFKKSKKRNQDFTKLPDDSWDHLNVSFERVL